MSANETRYRHLSAPRVVETVERLGQRIHERFPDSGLCKVCAELTLVAQESEQRARDFARPNVGIRLTIAAIVTFSLILLVYGGGQLGLKADAPIAWSELLLILDAGLNNLIVIGAALLFLFTFEARVKRRRGLVALHELRSIAHVIDMHQLTKDPSKLKLRIVSTPSSPAFDLDSGQLTRYLDYCSEMLALCGKIAAFYGENLRDPVVLSEINGIEELTTDLSRKIWQKIIVLHRQAPVDPSLAGIGPA